jgi:outer membrane biogenesis lipoprotein LolB
MQWGQIDLMTTEHQRELLASGGKERLAHQASSLNQRSTGWRLPIWTLGRALETLGRRLESAAARPEDHEPAPPRGAFV